MNVRIISAVVLAASCFLFFACSRDREPLAVEDFVSGSTWKVEKFRKFMTHVTASEGPLVLEVDHLSVKTSEGVREASVPITASFGADGTFSVMEGGSVLLTERYTFVNERSYLVLGNAGGYAAYDPSGTGMFCWSGSDSESAWSFILVKP